MPFCFVEYSRYVGGRVENMIVRFIPRDTAAGIEEFLIRTAIGWRIGHYQRVWFVEDTIQIRATIRNNMVDTIQPLTVSSELPTQIINLMAVIECHVVQQFIDILDVGCLFQPGLVLGDYHTCGLLDRGTVQRDRLPINFHT